ncbi:MAG TPA: heme o synthase [Kofleriaceae bacterium]|nr:heme o synthase [Kofleriaceae bacterium]
MSGTSISAAAGTPGVAAIPGTAAVGRRLRRDVPAAAGRPSVRDLLALVKPRITLFALMTALVGLFLAPGAPLDAPWIALSLGTALIVGAANTLNMYLERDLDCLMARTRTRPLPAGRMRPSVALWFGLALAFAAVPVLTFAVNPLTGLLGVVAFLSYVMLYTPLKQRTTVATLIGSIPGAMPPLLGWTAATGSIDPGGLALFGVMFFWQIPHFHAIAMFRRKDYDRAGLKILPTSSGEATTRKAIVFYLAVQVQLTLLLMPLGLAGRWYLLSAALLGGVYFAYGASGFSSGGPRWARNLFLLSILYLPLLMAAMVLDGVG